METGDVVDVYPLEGKVTKHNSDEVLARFELATNVLKDEVQADGRIPLIIGRGLTDRARKYLNLPASDIFELPEVEAESEQGFYPRAKNGRQSLWCCRCSCWYLL